MKNEVSRTYQREEKGFRVTLWSLTPTPNRYNLSGETYGYMTKMLYSDLQVGQQFEFGSRTITEDEIVRFAEKYDPQSFHLDPEAAHESLFGELVASGWQTVVVTSGLTVRDVFEDIALLAGRGVDNLRWHQPVYPGDTLSGVVEVINKQPSERTVERGYINFRIITRNQADERILSHVNLAIVKRSIE